MQRIFAVALAALSIAASSFAQEGWTRFRGPNGSGVSPEKGLPDRLDLERDAAWSVKTPAGASSPVVAGGRAFLSGYEGDERLVLCVDAASGRTLWRRSIRKARAEFFHKMHGPASPTPVIDGGRVFVFFPDLGLLAFDGEGSELWRRPLGPFRSVQGLAASPIAVNGLIAILVDTPEEAYLATFDAATGEPAWRTDRPTGVLGGYSTPALRRPQASPAEIIVAGARELTGYRADTGQRLWWGPDLTTYTHATPLVAGDAVFTQEPAGVAWSAFSEVLALYDANKDGQVSIKEAEPDASWRGSLLGIDRNVGNGDGIVTEDEYRRGTSGSTGGMYRVRLGGSGDVRPNVVWRHTRGVPSFSSPLLYEGVLLTVRLGIVSTFDPETGKLLRQERLKNALGEYYASPVAGDGKVYLVSQEGVATVLSAGAGWTVLATNNLGDEVLATPAIAGGRIFVRTRDSLYCFGKQAR